MNAALALEPNMLGVFEMPRGRSERLTVVGLPSKQSARELSGSAAELFKGIKHVVDDLLLRAIDKRTAESFIAVRESVFGDYFKTMSALTNLALVMVPAPTLERLMSESFSELEADLREQGLARFGATARDQAVFTVWTLRKVARLGSVIASAPNVPEQLRTEDQQIAKQFALASRYSQFHLECLVASMHFNKAIHPEVLTEICDGLRVAVNAYGLIRQAVDLRVPRTEPNIAPYDWDEEDDDLLSSSMDDMEAETESL